MENTAQTFSWALLAIPVLFALIPASLFYSGYRASSEERFSFVGKPCYWLGVHGITLTLVSLLYILRGTCVPEAVAVQLPLLFVLLYLILALALRSSFFLSIAIATPGLWLFCVQCWLAFSGAKDLYFNLPLEPFWYLLAAFVLFAVRYRIQFQRLWGEADGLMVTLSGSYLLGGLWLLALGQPSLLAALKFEPYVWAVVLLAASAVLLWCSRIMRESLLSASSLIGFSAGVYTFVTRYPWT